MVRGGRLSLLLLLVAAASLGSCLPDCGGLLRARRGVISTPAFPGPFHVPIRCRWLLDGTAWEQEDEEEGTGLAVYLSQMYLSTGLRFTEYDYFDPADPSLQRNPRLLLSLTEENSVSSRWIFTRSKFLLIELELDRLEGNHLRALDHLLDVFGFNITYEMAASRIRNDTCSVLDCSLAGNCYVSSDFKEFWCACFPGFSGAHCDLGPVCRSDSNPCQNGATCRHAGKYPTCACEPGFTGPRCEVPLIDTGCEGDSSDCSSQCRFDGREESICNCAYSGAQLEADRWRFIIKVRLANISALDLQHPGRTLYNFIEKHILRFFRPISLSRFEDLLILNISDSGDMSFHFFSSGHDSGKVRDAMIKMEDRQRLGELALTPRHSSLTSEPALRLEGIVTEKGSVREKDEVLLSCIALGSDQITFTWYKDGYSIDITKAAGGIWMKLLPKNSREEYTAILGIESARRVDEGQYTCHVADWGVQECKSHYLEVEGPPLLRLSPMAVSVNKGDDVDLKCVSPNQKAWYSWTRDRSLFPLSPGQEVWEDLLPWGSILRIKNVQKSTTYTCHAHTSAASRQYSVRVELLTRGSCPAGPAAFVLWPPTAPGSSAITDCPNRYVGYAERYCMTVKPGEAVWMEPDFSNCIHESLDSIISDFHLVSRGFMKTSLWSLLSELYRWSSRSRGSLEEGSRRQGSLEEQASRTGGGGRLRGEGEPALDLLAQVLDFVNQTFTSDEMLNVTKVFYANVDLLLSDSDAIIHKEKVGKLLTLVDNWSLLWNEQVNSTFAHLAYDEFVVDTIKLSTDGILRYYLPSSLSYPRWYTAKMAVDLMGQPASVGSKVVVVNYRNISKFFPRTGSQKLSDGSELTYEVPSNVVSISTDDGSWSSSLRLEMTLPTGTASGSSGDWSVRCARASQLSSDWDLSVCRQLSSTTANYTSCHCQGTGVYAALRTRQAKSSEDLAAAETVYSSRIVLLGCCSCLAQSSLSLLLLLARCLKRPTSSLLFKIQAAFSLSSLMCIFVYTSEVTPHQDYYLIISTVIEFFFFLGMASYLGKLLLIYTEVIYVPNFKSVKHTIFGITLGVTLLTSLMSLLAESVTERRSRSYWLQVGGGGGGFYPAFVSAALLLVLYLLLLTTLVGRLTGLLSLKEHKSNLIIRRRLGLLKRTTVLFFSLIMVGISSIAFVNSPCILTTYLFSVSSALLGFLTFFFYIIHSESSFNLKLMKQLKMKVKDPDYSSDSDYNLFNFFTKQEPEVESESAPPMLKAETSIPLKEMSDKILQKQKMVTFTDDAPFSDEEERRRDVDLEVYPNSPKKYQDRQEEVEDSCGGGSTEEGGGGSLASPTVRGSAALLNTPDILPNSEKKKRSELVETLRILEEGDKTPGKSVISDGNPEGRSQTDVLNRISHDLDYLLNRSGPSSPVTGGKVSQGTASLPASPAYIGKTAL